LIKVHCMYVSRYENETTLYNYYMLIKERENPVVSFKVTTTPRSRSYYKLHFSLCKL
jgi:hypothetical protein